MISQRRESWNANKVEVNRDNQIRQFKCFRMISQERRFSREEEKKYDGVLKGNKMNEFSLAAHLYRDRKKYCFLRRAIKNSDYENEASEEWILSRQLVYFVMHYAL